MTKPHQTPDPPDARQPDLLGRSSKVAHLPKAPTRTLSDRRLLVTRAVATFALVSTIAYLSWRTLATLNPDAMWLSLLFLAVETYGALSFGLFVFSLWDTRHVPKPPQRRTTDLSVAILIPTYNEPPEVLLPTVAAAITLEPLHETWLLDDGDRSWVAEMAEELGVKYLARADNAHAKAGNLNHALEHVDADLLAVLDADHVPQPRFLTSTIAYFDNAAIALVQTPQDFYNRNSFEHHGDYCEEELFYRAIQPGKNRWNAAFWCGTSAVIRREALAEVGGVATESLTEDIHTTIRLHRSGWQTVFHDEIVARGLAARSFPEFYQQRLRWGTGAMQVLRSEHPILGRGLSPTQRLSYLFTLNGWFESWRTLIYLVIPILVLFTGHLPLRTSLVGWLTASLITFASQQLAMLLLGRGWTRWFPALLFDILRMPAGLAATCRLFIPNPGRFNVTVKGRAGHDREISRVPLVHKALLATGAIAWAWFALSLLRIAPTRYESQSAALVALGFLLAEMLLVLLAINRIIDSRFASDRRGSVRMGLELDAVLDGKAGHVYGLSLNGGRVELDEGDLRTARDVELRIRLDTEVTLQARLIHADHLTATHESAFSILPGQWRERAEIARALLVRGQSSPRRTSGADEA